MSEELGPEDPLRGAMGDDTVLATLRIVGWEVGSGRAPVPACRESPTDQAGLSALAASARERCKAYACYFKNHPACQPNNTCTGAYFTCNVNCPAPTSTDIC